MQYQVGQVQGCHTRWVNVRVPVPLPSCCYWLWPWLDHLPFISICKSIVYAPAISNERDCNTNWLLVGALSAMGLQGRRSGGCQGASNQGAMKIAILIPSDHNFRRTIQEYHASFVLVDLSFMLFEGRATVLTFKEYATFLAFPGGEFRWTVGLHCGTRRVCKGQ